MGLFWWNYHSKGIRFRFNWHDLSYAHGYAYFCLEPPLRISFVFITSNRSSKINNTFDFWQAATWLLFYLFCLRDKSALMSLSMRKIRMSLCVWGSTLRRLHNRLMCKYFNFFLLAGTRLKRPCCETAGLTFSCWGWPSAPSRCLWRPCWPLSSVTSRPRCPKRSCPPPGSAKWPPPSARSKSTLGRSQSSIWIPKSSHSSKLSPFLEQVLKYYLSTWMWYLGDSILV